MNLDCSYVSDGKHTLCYNKGVFTDRICDYRYGMSIFMLNDNYSFYPDCKNICDVYEEIIHSNDKMLEILEKINFRKKKQVLYKSDIKESLYDLMTSKNKKEKILCLVVCSDEEDKNNRIIKLEYIDSKSKILLESSLI